MRISSNQHKRSRDRGKRDQPAVAKHDVYLPAAPTPTGIAMPTAIA
jgi:hypothetical protein